MLTEKILFKDSAYLTKYEGDKNIIDKHIEHILLFDKGRKGSNEGGYWLNINKGNDFNHEHIHELNGASAVYYHKVCCDKAPIVFKHLIPQIIENTVDYIPQEGDIIFFPSYLPHGVRACGNPEHERISFAINFKINKQSLGL